MSLKVNYISSVLNVKRNCSVADAPSAWHSAVKEKVGVSRLDNRQALPVEKSLPPGVI